MPRTHTAARMAGLVAAWRRTNESQASFARRHHIPTWTFGIGYAKSRARSCRNPRSRRRALSDEPVGRSNASRTIADSRSTYNRAENQLRVVAVGRKNWLFAGSFEGTRRAALLYSLVQSGKLIDVQPLDWLDTSVAPTELIVRPHTSPHPAFVTPSLRGSSDGYRRAV